MFLRTCDQLHFIREDKDGGQAYLGYCCFKLLQRFKFLKVSNQKYLLTIILGH